MEDFCPEVDKDSKFWSNFLHITKTLKPYLEEDEVKEIAEISYNLQRCIDVLQHKYVDRLNEFMRAHADSLA